MLVQELLIALAIILLTSFGQILLKKGANTDRHLIFNVHVISGYCCFVAVMLLSALLLYTIDFKYFSVIIGLNYMATTLLAASIIRERVTTRRYAGCLLIAVGSVLFTL